MNPGPPALEASTLPLGYRGGGISTTVTKTTAVAFLDFSKAIKSFEAHSMGINDVTQEKVWLVARQESVQHHKS